LSNIDEIQKVTGWSEVVKSLGDEDVRTGQGLKVLFLRSSSLLINQGWIYFGGYPGIPVREGVPLEEFFRTSKKDLFRL
jgi:hypothetical protein